MAIAAVLVLLAVPVIGIVPDPVNRLEVTVEKTGLYRGKKHRFIFERYRGSLQFDPEKPLESHVTLELDARSIVCKDTWVSDKDRRKIEDVARNDMLAADKFPFVTFVSTGVQEIGTGQYELAGDLTIHGIAKPATVMVIAKSSNSFEGTARVKMTAYGLKPPAAALGMIGTKDEMTFSFEIHVPR